MMIRVVEIMLLILAVIAFLASFGSGVKHGSIIGAALSVIYLILLIICLRIF